MQDLCREDHEEHSTACSQLWRGLNPNYQSFDMCINHLVNSRPAAFSRHNLKNMQDDTCYKQLPVLAISSVAGVEHGGEMDVSSRMNMSPQQLK